MGKLRQLQGVVNNLADSFSSPINIDFHRYVESLPVKKMKLFEIDLLKETIKPEDLMSKIIKGTISYYKNWFLSEIQKLKIKLSDIEKVSIKVVYKPNVAYKSGKKLKSAKYYAYNIMIRADDKDYTNKAVLYEYAV